MMTSSSDLCNSSDAIIFSYTTLKSSLRLEHLPQLPNDSSEHADEPEADGDSFQEAQASGRLNTAITSHRQLSAPWHGPDGPSLSGG